MIVVPAGKFIMGRDDNGRMDNEERPQHEVTIARPFAVGKYELTFDEWGMCVTAGACPTASDLGEHVVIVSGRPNLENVHWGRGERPVINVNWDDAKQYVAWLSRVSGKPYRLLTEAEWEYAARAGSDKAFSFGDNVTAIGDYAWHRGNSEAKTHPVGKKKPNAFGLYDV